MPETPQARAHRTIVSRLLQCDFNYAAIAAVHKRLDAGEGGSPNLSCCDAERTKQ
jgi:hypothetical protein